MHRPGAGSPGSCYTGEAPSLTCLSLPDLRLGDGTQMTAASIERQVLNATVSTSKEYQNCNFSPDGSPHAGPPLAELNIQERNLKIENLYYN